MKVYFDINNGECIKPKNNVPPAYRATFEWMRLTKLEACWDRKVLKGHLYKDPDYLHNIESVLGANLTSIRTIKKTMKRLAWMELFRLKKYKYTWKRDRWIYREFWRR